MLPGTPMSLSPRLTRPLLLLGSFVVLSVSQRCYLPNGNLDAGSSDSPQPCDVAAEFSACCSPDSTCLSNGYCYDPKILSIYRSSCTDQSWNSAACPYYCSDVQQDAGPQLYPIDGNNFCCSTGFSSSNGSCATPTHNQYTPFTLSNGYPIFNRTDGSTAPNSTQASGSSSTTASATTTTTTVTVTSTPRPSKAGGHETAVGLGVGVPLGVLLASALFFLGREVRHRKRLERQAQEHVRMGNGPGLAAYGSHGRMQDYKPNHEIGGRGAEELDTDRRAELSGG